MIDKAKSGLDTVLSAELSDASSFERLIGHVPAAFAVTRGPEHLLVYGNAGLRNLVDSRYELMIGQPLERAFAPREAASLTALLDRALQTGSISRDLRLDAGQDSVLALSCTIWPGITSAGESDHLLIELRAASPAELTAELRREVSERLLLSALRDQDAASLAERSRRDATFLAAESRRLSESLDEPATLDAMSRMSLPSFAAWCIVDTLTADGTMHRLAIIHPDPDKQALLDRLKGRWIPEDTDGFGLPAMLRFGSTSLVADNAYEAFATEDRDPQVFHAVMELGIGPFLTVALRVRQRLIGAVTFVGGSGGHGFTPDDVMLAEDLANRSAMALDRARLHGDAVSLRARADAANEAKSAFLGMMSHELRTPLNAIGGYVDLMDLEIHGPVTEAQHADLARIRTNQRYLMGLISDLLNFTRVGGGQLVYNVVPLSAHEVLSASVALVEPLITQHELRFAGVTGNTGITVLGDREKVIQILVNLLSNAIKFTPPGADLVVDCHVSETLVHLRVCDTGIGIPSERLEDIFEPFVQVKGGPAGAQGGVGLGLAISRDLARAMQGDLAVESTLGHGARFTLTLPVAGTVKPVTEIVAAA